METSYKNIKIGFNIKGIGKTVVLIHGFGETRQIWAEFVDVLSEKYQVLTMDLPGHGESECLGEPHTMEKISENLKHVLDENNIKQFVVIGHSMGGYAALDFANRYPGMVKGLGLFHSSGMADDEKAKINRDRVIELVKKGYSDFFLNFIPDLFSKSNQKKFQKEIKNLIVNSKLISSQAIIASMEGMKLRADNTILLRTLKIPLLFILGKDDTRVDYNLALKQATSAKCSLILSLDNVGHMGYIEARDITISTVKSFVDIVYY